MFLAPFDAHFRKKDLKEPDVMQHDVLVACDLEGNINEKGRYMGTPTLVVEILSDSTAESLVFAGLIADVDALLSKLP